MVNTGTPAMDCHLDEVLGLSTKSNPIRNPLTYPPTSSHARREFGEWHGEVG